MAKQTFEMTFEGRPLVVEVGQVAKQANGAVVVRYGDTTVLSVAVMSKKMATADFFPLQVNYEEKMYAAGKFPGGFSKREGRPSTDATLTARLIDRPIRPMFAEGFRNEVQVINTVLSYDENASAPMAAMFGSSLALSISDIPFNGPIAGVQVAYAAEDFIINPSASDKEVSHLDLIVAGTKEAINMVEAGAQELSEDIMLQALLKGHEAIQELVDFQNYIVAAVGKEKAEVELFQVNADLKAEIEAVYYDQLAKAVQVEEKLAREAATKAVKEEVLASYQERFAEDEDKETILGERALAQVLPSVEEFPYAIRLVAEVLESNGSSSQASICAGTLALMAGGVPIKAPVAGIAMGLISDGTNYTVLTDIQGLEDHFGDMDFKVAGTRLGITALQMDIKISGITPAILEEALAQAKVARFEILDVIESAIAEPRSELAPTAPKIDSIQIPVDKIKVVIGKGGETIDKIIAETGVTIDIDEEGLVQIFSSDQDAIDRAKTIISDLVREAKVGEVYTVPVVRIEKFGAFVHLFNKTDALVHISELAWKHTEHVEDVVKVGDMVTVKIIKIDEKGRVDASIKTLLPKPEKNEDGENGEEHRHCCCSHHKPDHHSESMEAPKKSDESETKE